MDPSSELGAFQSLPFECLLQIVSNLPLPECMFLRSSCYHLKTVVDEHFRTNVQTLPILLSAHYSPQIVTKFNRFQELKRGNSFYGCETLTFGSTSGYAYRKLVEEKGMFMEQKDYFRLENYLILFDLAKFDLFLCFIIKYLPKITKLALIIDHDDHMNHIPEVLNVYRKQLSVLLLEKTLRSSAKLRDNQSFAPEDEYFTETTIDVSNELYRSIDSLETLEELYFFAKWSNVGRFSCGTILDYGGTTKRFLKSMFQKLRVVHIARFCDIVRNYDPNETYEKLEELACHSFAAHGYLPTFPKLQKCILSSFSEATLTSLAMSIMPNLHELSLNCSLTLNSLLMNQLDFPNLERIHCWGICWRMSDLSRAEPNRTIKEIEIDFLRAYFRWEDTSDEAELKGLSECLSIFISLEKLIVREPFMELSRNQLRNLRDSSNLLMN